MIGKLYGNMDLMKAALDGSSLRYEAISNNMANINTPGYKKTTVSFENELQRLMGTGSRKLTLEKTNPKHIGKTRSSLENFKASVEKHEDTSSRRDKNNVNPDTEMINMAKTVITYNAIIDQINRKFNNIQSVITEGGK